MRKLKYLHMLVLCSCQSMVICPAFQSAYILDDSARSAYFSYVWQLDETSRSAYLASTDSTETNSAYLALTDSTETNSDSLASTSPNTDYYTYVEDLVVPWRVPKRTNYGIQKKVLLPIKNYRLKTSPMVNVLTPNKPIEKDMTVTTDTLMVDSMLTDSLATERVVDVATEPLYLYGYDPKDSFNVEQEYYNKYFGYQLIDTRPKPEPTDSTSVLKESASDSLQTKKKGFFRKEKKDKKQKPPETEASTEETDIKK